MSKQYLLYNAKGEYIAEFDTFNDCLFYMNDLKIGLYYEICTIGKGTRKVLITRYVYVTFSKFPIANKHWVDLAILPKNARQL